MPDFLRFAAHLHRIAQDQHGEWTVSFKVPLSEREAMTALASHTEESLTLVIGGTGAVTTKGRFVSDDAT